MSIGTRAGFTDLFGVDRPSSRSGINHADSSRETSVVWFSDLQERDAYSFSTRKLLADSHPVNISVVITRVAIGMEFAMLSARVS
jgi:hypothetical protein